MWNTAELITHIQWMNFKMLIILNITNLFQISKRKKYITHMQNLLTKYMIPISRRLIF